MVPRSGSSGRICYGYERGNCMFGPSCRYRHPVGYKSRQMQRHHRDTEVPPCNGHDHNQASKRGRHGAGHRKLQGRVRPRSRRGSEVIYLEYPFNIPDLRIKSLEDRSDTFPTFVAHVARTPDKVGGSQKGLPRSTLETWWGNRIRELFASRPRMMQPYLDQIKSPDAKGLWGQVSDIGSRPDLYRWRIMHRRHTTLQRQNQAKMSDGINETIFTPYYGLSVLDHISYIEFCDQVRKFDPGRTLGKADLEDVFRGVIENLFCGESEATKRAAHAQLNSPEAAAYWESFRHDAMTADEQSPASNTTAPTIEKISSIQASVVALPRPPRSNAPSPPSPPVDAPTSISTHISTIDIPGNAPTTVFAAESDEIDPYHWVEKYT